MNGRNRLADVNGAAASHDARGNLTAQGGRSFTYSSENLLTGVTAGAWSQTYSYDPLMRYSGEAGAGLPRSYAHDGDDRIVTNRNGQFLVRFVYGPGESEPLYQIDSQGWRAWFHADERGSVTAVSDSAGAADSIIAYDEYGDRVTNGWSHGYAGAYWMPLARQYHMGARVYDPSLGRFLQPDPIGYGDGMNIYAYVRADPVNRVDPTGLAEVCGFWVPNNSDDGFTMTAGWARGGCRELDLTFGSPGPGIDTGGGGASGSRGNGVATQQPVPPICAGVSRDRNTVRIRARAQFARGDYSATAPGNVIPRNGAVSLADQRRYVEMMSSGWTGIFGRYTVDTRVTIGAGMLQVYVGNAGAGGRAVLGGNVMWLVPLQPATGDPVYVAGDARVVAHEFGHILGEDHPPPGVDSGIMNRGSGGRPLEIHITGLLGRCGL